MKKRIFNTSIIVLFFCTLSFVCHAQNLGININNPQATLDVVGDVNLRKDLKVSDANGLNGTSGLKGQGLFSRGPNLSPQWLDIEGSRTTFRIRESVVLTDDTGLVFTDIDQMNITPQLAENSSIDNPVAMWKEITGLKSNITPTNKKNRVLITLQTMCHAYSSNDVDFLFSIGIFIDGELKAVRPLNLTGNSIVFEPSILYDSLENLPMKDNNDPYVIQVAVTQRYRNVFNNPTDTDWKVTVGTVSGQINANSWMNKTSLKVELYEVFLD